MKGQQKGSNARWDPALCTHRPSRPGQVSLPLSKAASSQNSNLLGKSLTSNFSFNCPDSTLTARQVRVWTAPRLQLRKDYGLRLYLHQTGPKPIHLASHGSPVETKGKLQTRGGEWDTAYPAGQAAPGEARI